MQGGGAQDRTPQGSGEQLHFHLKPQGASAEEKELHKGNTADL